MLFTLTLTRAPGLQLLTQLHDGFYLQRITILQACTQLATAINRDTLTNVLLPAVLKLAYDRVPNVRFNLCRVLQVWSFCLLLRSQHMQSSSWRHSFFLARPLLCLFHKSSAVQQRRHIVQLLWLAHRPMWQTCMDR